MKIAIVGHFVLDELHLHDGRILESYGGIWFAISAFAGIIHPEDRVVPLLPLGEDAADQVEARLGRLAGISAEGILRLPAPTTRVKLFYSSETSYATCLVTELPPVTRAQVEPHLDADLVYINMMTAGDISIEMLEWMRSRSRAVIYLDAHMLAYGVAENGSRHPAPHPQWERWVSAADIVQMNDREVRYFTGAGKSEAESVRAMLARPGVRAVVITRGGEGSTMYEPGPGGPRRSDIAAVPVEALADTTGCGDIFGSAFAYRYARGEPPASCGAFAAFAASRCAMVHGSEGLERLRALLGEAA